MGAASLNPDWSVLTVLLTVLDPTIISSADVTGMPA